MYRTENEVDIKIVFDLLAVPKHITLVLFGRANK